MAGSSLGKTAIVGDPVSPASSDTIVSYLSSATAILTSTTHDGKEALDVLAASEHVDGTTYNGNQDYLASVGAVNEDGNWAPFNVNNLGELLVSAAVNMPGDYAEDSAHTTGEVGLFSLAVRRDARSSGTDTDGDYASFNVNADGELYVKDTDTATALAAANSSLDAIETSVAAIDVDTSSILAELVTANATLASILADTATIDSQTLSIQNTLTALSKAEDAAHSSGDQGIQALAVRKDSQASNAADGDYTSLQTWSEGSMKVVDVANGSMLQQVVALNAVTATALPTSALGNRKNLVIQNNSAVSIYLGSATVTAAGATQGLIIPKNSFMELEVGPAVSVFCIAASGTPSVNVLEMA
jgi:hypothetical protein